MKEKCLRVMQGRYNMNVRCNLKYMSRKDRDTDFSIAPKQLIREGVKKLSSPMIFFQHTVINCSCLFSK